MPARKGRRRARSGAVRRWLAVGALVLVALLYYRPLRAYLDARAQRAERIAAVRRLRAEQAALERRLRASSSLPVLVREARALGYVRKGEHLFIVKNVEQWRKRQRAGHAPGRGR
ncbi:MAG: septum formation initiator family protein [Thermoleophilia bacterium]|nr:septum formation initiator family protein [Thermoleophilia bacterium]